jgi:hypothetical protein
LAHLPNGVWIPDQAARQNEAARSEQIAELHRMVEDGTQAVLDEWNRILYQIDSDLRMVRAKENVALPGLKPGFYHVIRPNPVGPPFIHPVESDEGEFREPGSWLLDELRASDQWNPSVGRARERKMQELDRQKQRAREREREERLDEVNERWKAASNPGVSFSKQGKGWRYRAGARRVA